MIQAPNLAAMNINMLRTFSDIGPLEILCLCPPYWIQNGRHSESTFDISEHNAASDLILVSKCMFFGGQGIQRYQFQLGVRPIYHSLLYTCIRKLSREILDSTQHFGKECKQCHVIKFSTATSTCMLSTHRHVQYPSHTQRVVHWRAAFLHLQSLTHPFLHLQETSSMQLWAASGSLVQ